MFPSRSRLTDALWSMISVGCFSTGADLNAIFVACDLFTQTTLAFLYLLCQWSSLLYSPCTCRLWLSYHDVGLGSKQLMSRSIPHQVRLSLPGVQFHDILAVVYWWTVSLVKDVSCLDGRSCNGTGSFSLLMFWYAILAKPG